MTIEEEKIVVLNVDDTEPQRYTKSRDLKGGGFDVIEAGTGAEALRLLEQHKPPIVLLDVQLPDITGLEVCQFIKRKWPEVMVLMTSATFTTPDDRVTGLDSGADSYLVQPAEPIELAAAINALLRIRKSEDELRALNEKLESRVRERTADLAAAYAKLQDEIAEREKAEVALIQAQKMEAVGQLTGGLAHDFNNLLTAVVGNLDVIVSRTTEPRIKQLAENAFKAAERGSKLTAQLLAFSRTQKLASAPVDVNRLVSGMQDLIRQTLGPSIVVQTVLAPPPLAAMTDVNQLELAILNLAINARDAMPKGGTLTIATGVAAHSTEIITVSVADTGTGMPPHVLARAFDPFFTTKPTGKGTGLGLSQVYGIAKQSGGDAVIESKEGKGTTITLLLPRTQLSTKTEAPIPLEAVRAKKAEKLLLVDDDSDVRNLVLSVLTDLGYEVREANHGDAALAILREFNPDLLVIDFAMPGMNGAEVVLAAHARNKALKVLFLSGHVDSEALESAIGIAPLLRKPFRPIELAAAIRQTLDSPQTPKAAQ